jgi:hypothetical protein
VHAGASSRTGRRRRWHECGLTPRSTGPATAGSVSLVRGTWCIISYQAYAACLRGPVSSNVRPHMKRPAALALVALVGSVNGISGVGAVSPPALLSTVGPLPLNSGQATRLFKQCSRPAPVPEGLTWQPSRVEIDQLEASLPSYLNATHAKGQTTPPVPPQYRGQYVAYTEQGQPRIYASFVPADAAALAGSDKGTAVLVCDGGSQFWGVVYNPATRSFTDLQFNGPR